jgi:hypothetical protein
MATSSRTSDPRYAVPSFVREAKNEDMRASSESPPHRPPPQSNSADDLSATEIFRHACPQDEGNAAIWTQILMTKPTLATFTKRIAYKGFASKRGPTNRNMWNWSKVFLLLQYPFVSYFGSNDPSTRCLGLVYIASPCVVRRLPHYPGKKHVLQIKPSVRRNLHHKATDDDEDNFYFSFETEEMVVAWESELRLEMERGVQEARGGSNDLEGDDMLQPMSLHAMDLKEAAHALKSLDGGHQKVSKLLMLDDAQDVMSDDNHDERRHEEDRNKRADVDSLITVSDDLPPTGKPPPRLDDDTTSNRSSAVSASSSRRSASQASSILPRYTESTTRRRSFFAADELLDCHNSEAVHRTHCSRCKVSPVIGYLYTCAVCEETCELCASCFRMEDHDIRHLFLLSPDMEGECLRILPSLEGGPFRITELILFEALFRIVGSDFDGIPTKPMAKRRLLTFWNALDNTGGARNTIRGVGSGVGSPAVPTAAPPVAVRSSGESIFMFPSQALVSERDLTLLCRDADVVTFQEFMFLVRCKLASKSAYHYVNVAMKMSSTDANMNSNPPPLALLPPEGSFVYISLAFSLLNRMMSAYRHGLENGDAQHNDDEADVTPMRGSSSITGEGSLCPFSHFLKPYQHALKMCGRSTSSTETNNSPSSSTHQQRGANVYVSQLEMAGLQMLLGACSIVPLSATEEMVSIALYTQLLRSMHFVATHAQPNCGEAEAEAMVSQQVAEDFPPSENWLREDDEELLPSSAVFEKTLARWKLVAPGIGQMESPLDGTLEHNQPKTSLSPAEQERMLRHNLVDVVEHVLTYEVGGALGLYTDQPESIHCEVCSACSVSPIIGFMYAEVAGGSGTTDSPQAMNDQSENEAECLHFCQACMSTKRWMSVVVTAKQSRRCCKTLRATTSNLSIASVKTIGAQSTSTTAIPSLHLIQLKRVPGNVIALYDASTGKVATSASTPSHRGSKDHRKQQHSQQGRRTSL